MAQNFIACDREQSFLLPPDVREWLPEDHLAWFVIDAVGVMDTSAFYGAYREDGHGRAADEPSMMISLLLYCWSRGVRSSRSIERACVEDVACRVVAADQRPDHATIARFVERHDRALADLFGEVLTIARWITSKSRARSSKRPSRPTPPRPRRSVSDAATSYRKSWRPGRAERAGCATRASALISAAPSGLSRYRGRAPSGCARASGAWRKSSPSSAMPTRKYDAYRKRGVMTDGRRFGRPPNPRQPPTTPAAKVNLTDPDSKLVHGMRGWIQGYNAQAACNERHLIVAAEVMTASPDFGHLGPMVTAAVASA